MPTSIVSRINLISCFILCLHSNFPSLTFVFYNVTFISFKIILSDYQNNLNNIIKNIYRSKVFMETVIFVSKFYKLLRLLFVTKINTKDL